MIVNLILKKSVEKSANVEISEDQNLDVLNTHNDADTCNGNVFSSKLEIVLNCKKNANCKLVNESTLQFTSSNEIEIHDTSFEDVFELDVDTITADVTDKCNKSFLSI
jgi:hypothetical protein